MVDGAECDYWANGLEPVASCPVCGGLEQTTKYSGLRDYVENVPGQWRLCRCIHCDCLFLNPRPKADAVGKAYRTYYTHESAAEQYQKDNGSTLLWRLANGYLNLRYGAQRLPASELGYGLIPLILPLKQQLDFFFRHLATPKGRLLDVGCGNGSFLLRAKQAGWSVLGLEPDPLAVRAAREAGVDVVEGTFASFESDSSFDVVTASHVIEHVCEPQEFLKKIFESLNPGGQIWIATPNVFGIGHAWFGSAWRGLEPPRHLVLFSAKALKVLLINAGFIDIKFRRRGRGAKYILNASAKIAVCQEQKNKRGIPSVLVDIAASLLSAAAEELVVTAKRPA